MTLTEPTFFQEQGIVHLEKTADKWGKNESGTEWQEKWWEYYGGSGQAEKNAHKWCKIDPNTYVDPGHAHIWCERYIFFFFQTFVCKSTIVLAVLLTWPFTMHSRSSGSLFKILYI